MKEFEVVLKKFEDEILLNLAIWSHVREVWILFTSSIAKGKKPLNSKNVLKELIDLYILLHIKDEKNSEKIISSLKTVIPAEDSRYLTELKIESSVHDLFSLLTTRQFKDRDTIEAFESIKLEVKHLMFFEKDLIQLLENRIQKFINKASR